KYTFCFAENDEAFFPPLPARRGLAADASAVTVLGISGTAEILPWGDGDTPEAILRPIATAMHAAVAVGGAAKKPTRGEQVLLLPPELARLIVRHQWDLPRVQRYLFDARCTLTPADAPPPFDARPVAQAPGDIHVIVTGGPGIKMTYLPLWGGGTKTMTKAVA